MKLLVAMSFCCLLVLTAPCGYAGVLIETHLAGIKEVQLKILLGGVDGAALQAVGLAHLRDRMMSDISSRLDASGVNVTSSASQEILVIVDLVPSENSKEDCLALSVTIELDERGRLERPLGDPALNPVWITSWSETQTRPTSRARALDEIAALALDGVDGFAARVEAANSYYSERRFNEPLGDAGVQTPQESAPPGKGGPHSAAEPDKPAGG